MNVLLDTHVLLWALYDSSRLSLAAKETIASSPCVVNIASLWELSIKHSLRKLELKQSVVEIADICSKNHIVLLGIKPEHCHRTGELPFIHRDPFDRLLVAQALEEDLALVSKDQYASQYGVRTVW